MILKEGPMQPALQRLLPNLVLVTGCRMNSYNNKTNVVITVFCYFNKKKSWVKKNMDSDYALTHEQHHYDITYINTCLFIQKLKQAQFNRGNYDYLVR